MFKHSVKVPRLYKTAAKVAKDAKEGMGSIKQLVYENRSRHPNIKAIYALVATLFQRDEEIENLLKRSQLLVKEPRSDPWLTKILIVELLWGKKSLPGNSKPEQTVLAYEQIFKAHISDIPIVTKTSDSDTKEDAKPRYVRVNTLRISLNEAVEGFRDEGWVLSKFLDKTDYKGFLDKITSLAEDEFLVDIHIPDLLIFPPKTQFYNHPAYKNGSIILQDKASCLPVHILGPPPGSNVLDMCAAPGMKTTQVAATINNEGKVYAVERDPRRFETLNRIVETSGATCITAVNKDVLTCTQTDFPEVQYILVDPSCSGSGMTGRLDFEQAKSNQRMEKLAGFQIKILRSALTRYPDAKRIVYSTCSVFPEENEDVVRQVLETNSSYKLVPATKFVNNTWKNFGSTEYGNIGSYCLYAKPNEDFTNGFFVAVFEKLEEGEENQFFNTKIYNFKKHVESQKNRKRKQEQTGNNVNTFGNNRRYRHSEEYFENNEYNAEDTPDIAIKEEYGDQNGSVKKKKKKMNDPSDIVVGNCSEPEKELVIKKENEELNEECIQQELPECETKKEKKKKKKKSISELTENVVSDVSAPVEYEVKKKKKKINNISGNIDNNSSESEIVVVKKEKKSNDTDKASEIDFDDKEVVIKEEVPKSDKKKRKKKRKIASEDISENVEDGNVVSVPKIEHNVKKKEKKARDTHDNENIVLDSGGKKKKKNKTVDNEDDCQIKAEVKMEKVKKKKKKDITA